MFSCDFELITLKPLSRSQLRYQAIRSQGPQSFNRPQPAQKRTSIYQKLGKVKGTFRKKPYDLALAFHSVQPFRDKTLANLCIDQ